MKRLTIRLGIVGCGMVTEKHHLPALARVEGVRVVALADVDATALERLAARYHIARRYTNYRAMLDAGGLDAVAVCVPPQLHAPIALDALDAGQHLFVEKPLALSLEECDRLLERAAQTTLKTMVGFNLRRHRQVRAARDALLSETLGRLRMVRTVFTTGLSNRDDPPAWRARSETGGGAFFDLAVHHFDALRFLLRREVEEVSAACDEQDETAIISARMNDGTLVSSAFGVGAGDTHEIEIFAERGRLRLSLYRFDGFEQFAPNAYSAGLRARVRQAQSALKQLPRAFAEARRGGEYQASYAAQWRHFVDAVRHDTPTEATLSDGRRALEIALAATRASAQRHSIKINGDDNSREY